MKTNSRVEHLVRLYGCLDELEKRIGGKLELSACHGRMNWPNQGVYFFFEDGEERTGSGNGPRVVRVGTHAVSKGSKTTLWKRLYQHKGTEKTGGGNHRVSIFRLNVGAALQQAGKIESISSWGKSSSASREIVNTEFEAEKYVSNYIGKMPFLFIRIEDESSKESDRAFLEKNLIGLLSEFEKAPIDPPSKTWLGNKSPKPEIGSSGLWNSNYIEFDYDPNFLNLLEHYICNM
ncbi:hypothetical protein SAMN02745704_01802 [Paucidesulfovibrio gracilis DSM 16080]|uniref:GIY-YIG domain-containing protein n=1 Tax=Paucidesulfovibrio gracilis DSM 16080 TaxID=1121449 RepID=A0A1T4X4Z0_9BACT|nr:hypothetical protein [Paucidesulfovibrio gracilis]SKA84684.1 hypothetical protein SAMN02745704_01802 [Paucidesulfovibrio gracilis DSM 16080]